MILQLQEAQGRWAEGQHNEEWLIVNKDGEEIARLPACLKDYEAMRVIHFGRKFEMQAFEDGIEEGLSRGKEATKVNLLMMQAENAKLQSIIKNLQDANTVLATELNELSLEGT